MKHPTTSRWNVVKTSQWYVSTTSYWNVVTTSQEDVIITSHQYVFTTSQASFKWNTQRNRCGTTPPLLRITFSRRLVSRSLICLQVILSWPPSDRLPRLIWISNQTPKFCSTNQEGNKKSSLEYKLAKLLLYLKTATCINNICYICNIA